MREQQIQVSDLFVLVADQNILAAVRGLMNRRKSLRVSERFSCEVRAHPERDPGCLMRAHEFLSPFQRQFQFAMVVFDREGCGSDEARDRLESAVEQRLSRTGWETRSAAIVLDPELENWVWSESPHVDDLLGWKDRTPALREWLRVNGDLEPGVTKPSRPKETMEKTLQKTGKPRSSSIYEALARKVGLASCQDPAFLKFRTVLQSWFPSQ